MAEKVIQNDTHIEQMRELMVGPQIRDMTARLEQIESSLTLSQGANEKRFDEVMDGFLSELNKAVAASDKKIRALDLKAVEERAELRAQIEQLDDKIDARLDTLEADLASLQEESRKRLSAMQESLTGTLNSAVESSDKRIQSIASKTQSGGADVRNRLKRAEDKLETRFQSLNDEIESNATTMRSELSQSQKSMQEELQRLRSQLSNELNQRFLEVRDSKVSKDDISEILIESGMRIKGMEFVNEVPQLPEQGTSSRSGKK